MFFVKVYLDNLKVCRSNEPKGLKAMPKSANWSPRQKLSKYTFTKNISFLPL
jgi:hypothetical protein